MKYIITESQYRILNEEPEEILEFPFIMFNNDWNFLQEYIVAIGNPPYKIIGDLDLYGTKIKSLGSLISVDGHLNLTYNKTIESLGELQHVGGDLYLYDSNIKSLGNLEYVGDYLNLGKSNIESLGNLKSVGGDLYLSDTEIESLGNLVSVGGSLVLSESKIESLGNLQSVGGDLELEETPLSQTTTEAEIRNIPNLTIVGKIYL